MAQGIEIEFTFTCRECDGEVEPWHGAAGNEILISPCEDCLEKAREEGRTESETTDD